MSLGSLEFDPLSSRARLIIYIDFKSPYAYLAKDPSWALADELRLDIDWRPFTLDIPSYLGSARLDKQNRVVESQRTETQWRAVKSAYADVRRYGSLRKLVVRGTTKIWDSSLAAIGMLWAKQHGSTVLRAYMGVTYERFWKRDLDIEEVSVIEGVLREAGAITEKFREYASREGRELHDHIQRAAFDAGIFGVPTFIVDGEMFFGREHLPRIKWILLGRHGSAPDVAYESGESAKTDALNRAPLTLAIDFASPRAYLALMPTCALAEQLGIEIDWKPFLVEVRPAPLVPSSAGDRGTRHRAIRAAYVDRDLARYLADRGIVRDLGKHANSRLAAITLLWLNRESPQLVSTYVQKVFEGHWRGDLDIESEAALRDLLQKIGAPLPGYETFVRGDGLAELDRVRGELLNAGVLDVPAYVIGGEVFIGREHLPLVRDRLKPTTVGERLGQF
jgi:2-hydroxychromene-2-carboxylate isomerase